MNDPQILKMEPAWREFELALSLQQQSVHWRLEASSDGAQVWVPSTLDPFGQALTLDAVRDARHSLIQAGYDAAVIDQQMNTAAHEILDGPDFQPGHDSDGHVPWEPNGRPSTQICVDVNVSAFRDQLHRATELDLIEMKRDVDDMQRNFADFDDTEQIFTNAGYQRVVYDEMVSRHLIDPPTNEATQLEANRLEGARHWHHELIRAQRTGLPKWLPQSSLDRRVQIPGTPAPENVYLVSLRSLDELSVKVSLALDAEKRKTASVLDATRAALAEHDLSPQGAVFRRSVDHPRLAKVMSALPGYDKWITRRSELLEQVDSAELNAQCTPLTSPAATALEMVTTETARQVRARLEVARSRGFESTDPATNTRLADRLANLERSGRATSQNVKDAIGTIELPHRSQTPTQRASHSIDADADLPKPNTPKPDPPTSGWGFTH